MGDAAIAELRRCVEELGFVGCNLNQDPSGGHWTSPPLIDPQTGHHFDDTRRYVEALGLTSGDRTAVFETNARRVYPRLRAALTARTLPAEVG